MEVFIVCLNFIIFFSVVLVCSAQQPIDRATKIKVKEAIDNIVGGFVEEEERNSKPGNSFGYFIQYTSVSKQLSRDARLVSQALQEVDSLAGKDNITAGADYALGSQAQGLSGLTKTERLKLIFAALDKKERIIKRKRSRGFRSSGPDAEVKKNPLTGSCVEEKEVGISSVTSKEIDISGDLCKKKGFTTCIVSERYRSIDGTCNNLGQSRWGATLREYRRIFPAEYPDGKGQFKSHATHTRNGRTLKIKLPSVRTLSKNLHQVANQEENSRLSPRTSHMLMQFGQFLDHDTVLTPEPEMKCCQAVLARNKDICQNIMIPKKERNDDVIYNFSEGRNYKQTCIPFSRSEALCDVGEGTVREQFNAVTAFLDMSAIYGSDSRLATGLRRRKHWQKLGTLAESDDEHWNLPTRGQVKLEELFHGDTGAKISGDNRCTEHPGLLTMHTVFFLEHNRIAKGLHKTEALRKYLKIFNSTKEKDDFIFEETRQLVAATFQSITYREYLPLVVGPQLMREYGLLTELGKQSMYDSKLDPTHWHEFATFAYRFGHSLIGKEFEMVWRKYRKTSFILIDAFFNGTITQNRDKKTWWISVMRGLTAQRAEMADRYINTDLSNKLFMSKEKEQFHKGSKARMELSDLAARNIQRGRDHGSSDYNNYRKWAGLLDLTHFGIAPCLECCECWMREKIGGKWEWRECSTEEEEERYLWYCSSSSDACRQCLDTTETQIRNSARKKPFEIDLADFIELGNAYFWFLDMIDPFTGALFEKPVSGGEVGPTNGRIIADQFRRLKYGDRFFFNHRTSGHGRGLGQVAARNVFRRTLSSVLCDNAPMTKKVKLPENAFKSETETKIKTCQNILDGRSLELEKIAQEIVESFGSTSKDSSECDFDDDCKEEIAADEDAYVVCTDRRCEFVTGECLEDADCAGGQCQGNFCLFKKREETSFRRKCQEENNCEELDNCDL